MQSSATPDHVSCNGTHDSLATGSERCFVPSNVLKLTWCLRHWGLIQTSRLVWSKIGRVLAGKGKGKTGNVTNKSAGNVEENLNLQPGELVEVKSELEILETLDEHGRQRGLLWMPTMAKFCGNRYKVQKRVAAIMLESTGELRKIRNTVLLEGVMCEDLYGCDRLCFHYWREAWLRRVL